MAAHKASATDVFDDFALALGFKEGGPRPVGSSGDSGGSHGGQAPAPGKKQTRGQRAASLYFFYIYIF